MLVVGLSGAQGGGKSSLLIELQARGWKLDQFRVSRAVQAQLGWDKLDTVMESWDTMTQFQDEVFRQKFAHDFDLSALEGDDVVLTERTFADICAYTTMWAWRHVDRGNVSFENAIRYLHEYTASCSKAHTDIYSATLLLPYMPDVIKWEEDPNRAARDDVDRVYEDVSRFLERKVPINHKKLLITTKSVPDRATQVENFLRSL